jgi:integrase/recombinase XerD
MQMLFKRMYRWAGLDHASSHSGRRTFATSLIERGVDIKAVSSLMGHSSVAMTARYVQDNPIRLRRICEEVNVGV